MAVLSTERNERLHPINPLNKHVVAITFFVGENPYLKYDIWKIPTDEKTTIGRYADDEAVIIVNDVEGA